MYYAIGSYDCKDFSSHSTRDPTPMPTILTERSIRDAEAVARQLQAALVPVLWMPAVEGRRAATLVGEWMGGVGVDPLLKADRVGAGP